MTNHNDGTKNIFCEYVKYFQGMHQGQEYLRTCAIMHSKKFSLVHGYHMMTTEDCSLD